MGLSCERLTIVLDEGCRWAGSPFPSVSTCSSYALSPGGEDDAGCVMGIFSL